MVLVGLAIAGNELAGIEGIAIAQSLSLLGGTVAQLRLAFPREWRQLLVRLGAATAGGAAVIVAAAAPGLVLYEAAGRDTVPTLVAAALCCGLALLATRVAFPYELRSMAAMARARGRG